MIISHKRSTRGKMLSLVAAVALLLTALILLRRAVDERRNAETRAERVAFAAALGWELDPQSEESAIVDFPQRFDGVIADYNALQLSCGYDLSPLCGSSCRQYSYRVLNPPRPDEVVLLTLYVHGGRVIGGDVHSTALDGFMIGLVPKPGVSGGAQ